MTSSKIVTGYKIALLSLGERTFALPVGGILQILPTPAVYPLPLLPEGVVGIILIRGEAAPFIDLVGIWSTGECESSDRCRYTVVYGSEFGVVGLPVEQVLRIVDQEQGIVEQQGDEEVTGRGFFGRFVFRDESYPLLVVENLLLSLHPDPGPGNPARGDSRRLE